MFATYGDEPYVSYETVWLRWHLEKAQGFIKDVGRWDDYKQMLDSPVMREAAEREIR